MSGVRTTPASRTPGRQADVAHAREVVDLSVGGMTCASCAARIERVLARQPGVEHAGVNYATARASVTYDPAQTNLDALTDAVVGIGYEAAPVSETPASGDEAAEERAWLRRVLVAWPLGIAVFALLLLRMDRSWARWIPAGLTVPSPV